MGLLAIEERTLMADGRYEIESQPGLGARIELLRAHLPEPPCCTIVV